jgi:hypothetical protein
MAQRRTSLRHSGGSESAVKNRSTSPGPTQKKTQMNVALSSTGLIFIEVFRELSKHTTYLATTLYFINFEVNLEEQLSTGFKLVSTFQKSKGNLNVKRSIQWQNICCFQAGEM